MHWHLKTLSFHEFWFQVCIPVLSQGGNGNEFTVRVGARKRCSQAPGCLPSSLPNPSHSAVRAPF